MAEQTLKAAREKRGWTTQDVADRVGCHNSTISRIERGEIHLGRQLARDLFRLFEGDVPLSCIYDPEFHTELTRPKRKDRANGRQHK